MKTVTISASKEYHVHIGAELLDSLGTMIAEINDGQNAVIVSDSNVWPIYGQKATDSLLKNHFSVHNFVFSAGEESKNPITYLNLLNFLAENHITRSDCIIALGGGVVGDMAGFAASTYLRGISYIQVPTTLLSMVDSSVGGKTGIDLPAGKNLVGTFYQPSLVLCDTATLRTLPHSVFADGCAEVIKYGILYDENLFSQLEKEGPSFCTEEIIFKCIEWKKSAVMQDEFDIGARQMLNLGHTIGHAIEKASGYAISHGKAVSIGISIATKIAVSLNLCSDSDWKRIIALLSQFDLPISTEYSSKILAEIALSDKKRSGNHISLVLPATIGCCKLQKVPVHQLESLIKAGM